MDSQTIHDTYFKQEDAGGVELPRKTRDAQGNERDFLNSDNSAALEEKGIDYLYPYQIWLLQYAPDEIITKHKDIIKADYERYCLIGLRESGSRAPEAEAQAWVKEVEAASTSEVVAVRTMVSDMNVYLPVATRLGNGYREVMLQNARLVGRFGR